MPAYNSEKYIAKAIDSILLQTYLNFELLILNDGSTDSTQEILNKYQESRVKIFHFDSNKGLVAARNTLVQHAKGKYVAFLDADDWAMPERLAAQVNFLELGLVDIVGSDYLTLNVQNQKIKRSKQPHSDSDIKALLTIYSPLCNPSIMGRIELFKKYPYSDGQLGAEDYSLWIDLALANYRFQNLRKNLIIYTLHPEQTSIQNKRISDQTFVQKRNFYLKKLGVKEDFWPRPLNFYDRLVLGVSFMKFIRRKFINVSFNANCQLYSRFQPKNNGIFKIIMRVERYLVAAYFTYI